MTVYCISYDLNGEASSYSPLFEGIKSFGIWWHQAKYVWVIKTDKSAKDVRDYLKQFIQNGDKLFVVEVVKHWAGTGFSKEEYDWLKKNFD